jgi:hypothetical protein
VLDSPVLDSPVLDSAALARERLSLGRYHRPNKPRPRPAAQVHIHQRTSARKLPRMTSRTMSATAHPAVMILVTS